ncbi:MAG: hypothetical protein NXI26_24750 [bacterium]|uniref:Uncharacterized protein n=1 Tax=Phaeodactylibacter xiamenensis TaxID=1524460 RepID=A0A098RZA9_9BACT|nr:hypothetical protein [Phaeodactylibacter xiamenensis]KGE84858.1 hypothetical protein IX84_31250 [Phaeodactylibacter xiamenensis]MCR9055080.1 hypothetical protein [bacterium]
MKKVFLTIDVNVNDKCFDDLLNFKKVNIIDIVNKEEINQLEKIRGKVIAEKISEIEKDILIGFAVKNKNDLKTVLELSGRDNFFKIYYDDGKRRKEKIEKYKQEYSLHARWLDYSSEFVENSFRSFDEEVKRINIYAAKNKIETIAI